MRIEEAGLNALQTQRQLFFDGWLLRISPGKAKRARSVNPHFGSSLPLDMKIARCESVYTANELPTLFRMTPFVHPPDLRSALERRGYVCFDPTLVQVLPLDDLRNVEPRRDIELVAPSANEFVEAIGELRASSPTERAAHVERLACTPLPMHAILARIAGRTVACGQASIDDRVAGIYDMMTAGDCCGRGIATTIVNALLQWARSRGTTHAFLQVNADNAPALRVYRRFGFATTYTYYYLGRRGECR